MSAAFPAALERAVAPRLDGSAERLAEPDARFLDVGAGVAAMAVETARRWPSLRVVGVDPWAPPIALARDNVRAAGLADRTELREQRAEDPPGEDRFDLDWTPGLFTPERVLPLVLKRVARALRPGGRLLPAFVAVPGDNPLAAALARLRTALWGGAQVSPAGAEGLLARAGLADVEVLPSPPGSAVAIAAGRRRA